MEKQRIDWKSLFVFLAVPQLIGFVGWLLGGSAGYEGLHIPDFAPPPWVFAAVWPVLYLMMGLASWLARREGAPLGLYWLQLAVNSLWSLLFFRLEWRLFALVWLVGLLLLAAWTAWDFYRAKPAAGWLMGPYLLWLLYAATLNTAIWRMNL